MVEAPQLELRVRRHLRVVLVKEAHDSIIVALRVGAATADELYRIWKDVVQEHNVETASDPHALAHVPGPIE